MRSLVNRHMGNHILRDRTSVLYLHRHDIEKAAHKYWIFGTRGGIMFLESAHHYFEDILSWLSAIGELPM